MFIMFTHTNGNNDAVMDIRADAISLIEPSRLYLSGSRLTVGGQTVDVPESMVEIRRLIDEIHNCDSTGLTSYDSPERRKALLELDTDIDRDQTVIIDVGNIFEFAANERGTHVHFNCVRPSRVEVDFNTFAEFVTKYLPDGYRVEVNSTKGRVIGPSES